LGYDAVGEPMLDIIEYQNPTTSNEVFNALNSYGPKGRQAYLTYLLYDIVFVIARSAPVIVLCTWAYKKAPAAIRPGAWLPLLNIFAELFESFMLFGLIKAFPYRNKTAELITAYAIRFKWITFQITLAVIFISLMVGIYYGFHGLLADSVVMEKERQQKVKAREQVQDVLDKSAARRVASDALDKSEGIKKNS
jgi:hypothetical protein